MLKATPDSLRERVVEVARALRERDEDIARAELRALAAEATALSKTTPLFPAASNDFSRRQTIAVEKSEGKTKKG